LWVVAGGLVASYLLQQNQTTSITPGDGALVGLFAGFFGAAAVFIVSIPVGMLTAPMEHAILERVLTTANNLPPEMQQALENYTVSRADTGFFGQLIIRVVSGFLFACVFLIIGSIFSTLGGLLGAAIFARRVAPPAESL
jgi:hypothetical protein